MRREHPGFCPRIAKSNAVNRFDALAQKRRQLDLRLGSRAPRAAVAHRPGHSFDHRRIRVAMNEDGVVAEQIDVLVAVDVAEERSPAALDGERVGPVVSRGASVAAGHDALGALGELRGFLGRSAVVFLDTVHRCHTPMISDERLCLCFHFYPPLFAGWSPPRTWIPPGTITGVHIVYTERSDASNCKKL